MPYCLEVPAPERKLARRLDQLAEQLGFDRERLRLWSLAQVVLGAWWGYDEHGDDWRTWIWCAELLDGLKA
jgi:streptomycin 6-kinase